MRKAEVESTLWTETQILIHETHGPFQPMVNWQSLGATRICFLDGVWRAQDTFTG